ncbi:MAG: PspC domain-containing protein [Dehalococcoidia bacterium]|jgi:phage shock protein C|nr:PspC domain-containing protein [Dehalococcoidia bacterium]
MAGEAGPKRLRRSDDRKIGGVAGGVAEYLNVDPTIVRVVFVVLLILGAGITWAVVYGVLWLLMPEFEAGAEQASEAGGALGGVESGAEGGVDSSVVFGVVLLGLGVLLLSSRFTVGFVGLGGVVSVWPTVVLLIGVVVVMAARDRMSR